MNAFGQMGILRTFWSFNYRDKLFSIEQDITALIFRVHIEPGQGLS